jgi:hypothetical protein
MKKASDCDELIGLVGFSFSKVLKLKKSFWARD